jgi:hypothetical protein
MSRSLIVVICCMFGCSSGTESGNPNRGGNGCTGVACAPCAAAITLQITDSSTGVGVGTAVVVDGQPITCSTASTGSNCPLVEPSYAVVGERQVVVTAAGYSPTTVTANVPTSDGAVCCACPTGSVVVQVTLDPAP